MDINDGRIAYEGDYINRRSRNQVYPLTMVRSKQLLPVYDKCIRCLQAFRIY